MATNATDSDPGKTKVVSDQEVDAVVDAALADLATECNLIARGWTLDRVGTLRTKEHAAEALTTDKPAGRCNGVRTAILLAQPVKG